MKNDFKGKVSFGWKKYKKNSNKRWEIAFKKEMFSLSFGVGSVRERENACKKKN